MLGEEGEEEDPEVDSDEDAPEKTVVNKPCGAQTPPKAAASVEQPEQPKLVNMLKQRAFNKLWSEVVADPESTALPEK